MRLTKNQIDDLFGPLVYKVYSEDGALSYVGVSSVGASRVFSTTREQPLRRKAIKACLYIDLEFFDTYVDAASREAELIHEHHPYANRVCPRCSLTRDLPESGQEREEEIKRIQDKHIRLKKKAARLRVIKKHILRELLDKSTPVRIRQEDLELTEEERLEDEERYLD